MALTPSQAIDVPPFAQHHCGMAQAIFTQKKAQPQVVGSFGSLEDLSTADLATLRDHCDIAEIRLDIVVPEGARADRSQWQHLVNFPLLFTARRREEGGVRELGAAQRMDLLAASLDDAALVDIEVASIAEMADVVKEIKNRGIPWVASFHDFEKLPTDTTLAEAAKKAREAGAAIFKTAARVTTPGDLARLAEFQLTDHGIPVSSMGMGPLAPVSRLLCAQSGSVLNYGYVGSTPTAPGQWDSLLLKQAIARLALI